MTYEKSGPQVPYLSHIDLMQLQILYHPEFQNKYKVDAIPHILCGGFNKEVTENLLIDL